MLTSKRNQGEMLVWNLMKFCKDFKPNEIQVFGIHQGKESETLLTNWEGNTKTEKLKSLVDVIDSGHFEEIDIVLPNSHSYEF